MGVYIKDMTLEEFSDYGDYCQTLIGTGQAEEVPPHGRLIDADAFKKKNAYYWGRDFIGAKYEDCLCDLINDAPTIIPAEEGET